MGLRSVLMASICGAIAIMGSGAVQGQQPLSESSEQGCRGERAF